MRKALWNRALALLICLCLLPLTAAGAQEAEEAAVTRSDFTLSVNLHADGFPANGATRFADWEAFLQKLSLRGVADTQKFLQPYSRVYFDGGLYLGDKLAVPFEYDGYHSYRYLRSPALRGASVHFQMHNFFEFMLKPYYFMGLPTQYLALLMYPEASYYVGESFYAPIAEAFAGEGTRAVAYPELYELCESLDLITVDDGDYERMYYYVTSLLLDLQASDMTLTALGDLEGWLDFLDPEQRGMKITVNGDHEAWLLGTTTVFEKTAADGATRFTLRLPNSEGYVLEVSYSYAPEAVGAALYGSLKVLADGEERLSLTLSATGLPKAGETAAQGSATFSLGGSSLDEQTHRFDFRYDRDAAASPFGMSLSADWIHPQTGLPALTLSYAARVSDMPPDTLVEREYDNQNDFFNLNESYLEEFKQRFLPTLALAFVPIVLETPAGVINDTLSFLNDSGMLATLGFE